MERSGSSTIGRIPAEVDVAAYASLRDIFERSCQPAALPAYVNMGAALITHTGTGGRHARARGLQKGLGLKRGERIAILMPNLLQYPVALFRALRRAGYRGQRQPAIHRARTGAPAQGSALPPSSSLGNFAHAGGGAAAPGAAWVTTRVGDLFPGLQGLLTNGGEIM